MRSLRAGLVAVTIAGTCIGFCEAAKLPSWAVEIAEQAPPIEARATEDPWRLLLSSTAVTVQPDGKLSIVRQVAGQALKGAAAGPQIGHFTFDDDMRLQTASAWHRLPDGKVRRVRGPEIDLTLDGSFHTDQRTRILPVSDVRSGSLVFYAFEAISTPETLTHTELFYEGLPVARARFEVRVPEGWSVDHDWLRLDGPDPVVDGNRRIWELTDLPGPAESEPLGEPVTAGTPLLVLSFRPPDGAAPVRSAVTTDWPALAAWYETLARDRHVPTPEIEALAGSLGLAGMDEVERVVTAGRYVRDSVRYIAREVGIGGYRPRPAGQVLAEKLGDCKDKGTLFRSLLEAVGVETHALLVNATRERTVSETVPSLAAFNHFVVGVRMRSGDPSSLAAATLELDGGERLAIVDTTDEWTTVGFLPANLSGRRALWVAGETSRLITLPTATPAAHLVERRMTTDVRADGSTAVELEIRRIGQPAATARALLGVSRREYREERERRLLRPWPGAAGGIERIEPETAAGELIERAAFQTPAPPGSGFTFCGSLLDDLPRVPLRQRERDVVYPHPLTLRHQNRITGVQGAARPPDLYDSGTGWSVSTNSTQDGDAILATCEVVLSRTRFPPTDFDELRRLWRAVRTAAAAAIRGPDPARAEKKISVDPLKK